MGQAFGADLVFPVASPAVRHNLLTEDMCPDCGNDLDTGWECLDCQFDGLVELWRWPSFLQNTK